MHLRVCFLNSHFWCSSQIPFLLRCNAVLFPKHIHHFLHSIPRSETTLNCHTCVTPGSGLEYKTENPSVHVWKRSYWVRTADTAAVEAPIPGTSTALCHWGLLEKCLRTEHTPGLGCNNKNEGSWVSIQISSFGSFPITLPRLLYHIAFDFTMSLKKDGNRLSQAGRQQWHVPQTTTKQEVWHATSLDRIRLLRFC